MGHKISKKSSFPIDKGYASSKSSRGRDIAQNTNQIDEVTKKEDDSFLEILKSQSVIFQKESGPNNLSRYLEEYDKVSKEFLENGSAENLKKFRQLLQGILNAILKDGVSIKKFNNFQNRGFSSIKKEYTVVQINKELENLSQFFMRRSNKEVNLLKKIEEIRGLLIDLLS